MRIIMGDLLTGRRILDVPYVSASWSAELNGAGTVKATVDLRDPDVRALDLRNAATLGKAFLGAVEDDRHMEAGPIWARAYDQGDGTLEVTASGAWSYFDRRILLPDIGDLPVIDPATGESAAYANSSWSGLHLGTIGKRIIQQSMLWPGGDIPIQFEADKPGDHERNYVGADLPVIGDMLTNLTEVEGGPDIEFRPQWAADRLGVQWLYRSGDPRITSMTDHVIDASVPGTPVKALTVSESGANLAALAWCSGGRSGDESLIDRAWDQTLPAGGFPLMEIVDSSRSSVKEAATITSYAMELARISARPRSQWALTVHTGGDGEPRASEYSVGDYLRIKVGGDRFIPDGVYRRRIVNLSRSAGDPHLKIGLGEDYG